MFTRASSRVKLNENKKFRSMRIKLTPIENKKQEIRKVVLLLFWFLGMWQM